mmetsp:Transcript_33368/g.87862  ORF Transcript_33368/g.87862 Transcript_33368/m.87862 type:complete len:102 (-) Transcript_33368:316-621(-)
MGALAHTQLTARATTRGERAPLMRHSLAAPLSCSAALLLRRSHAPLSCRAALMRHSFTECDQRRRMYLVLRAECTRVHRAAPPRIRRKPPHLETTERLQYA